MISRWTWFQILIIIGVTVCFYLVELTDLNSKIAILSKDSSTILATLLPISFLIIVNGSISLLLLMQEKKKNSLLNHKIWDKMYIVILVIFCISSFVFMGLFVFTPLVEWAHSTRLVFYIQIGYFLTLFYLLILSLVYKFMEEKGKREQMIYLTFLWTMILTVLIVFVIPGI